MCDPSAQPPAQQQLSAADVAEIYRRLDESAAKLNRGQVGDALAGIAMLKSRYPTAAQDSELAALICMQSGLIKLNNTELLAAARHFRAFLHHARCAGNEALFQRASVLLAMTRLAHLRLEYLMPFKQRMALSQAQLTVAMYAHTLHVVTGKPFVVTRTEHDFEFMPLPPESHSLIEAIHETAQQTLAWSLQQLPLATQHALESNLVLGELAELTRDFTTAIGHFHDAYALACAMEHPAMQIRCLVAAAKLDNNWMSALEMLEVASVIADQISDSLPLETQRIGCDYSYKSIFDSRIQILIAADRTDEALLVADSRKARQMRYHLDMPALATLDPVRELAVMRNATIVTYDLLQGGLAIHVIQPSGQVFFRHLDISMHDFDSIVERAIYDIRLPLEVSKTCKNRRAHLKEALARAKAKADSTALPKNAILAADVNYGKEGCTCVPGPPIAGESQLLSRLLIGSIRDLLPAAPAESIATSEDAPALVFVASDHLHLVPFAGLRDVGCDRDPLPVAFDQCRYLVENFSISVAPSLALLCHWNNSPMASRAPAGKAPRIAVVGHSDFSHANLTSKIRCLPHASTEMSHISRIYSCEPIDAALMTPRGILEHVFPRDKDYEVLHMCTHAYIERVCSTHGAFENKGAFVMGSDAVPLTKSHRECVLPSTVIGHHDLSHVNLCVLSACRTAEGQIISENGVDMPSEGPLSMARAFHRARVPAVVGTLFSINDTSATIQMVEFHKYLSRGRTYAQALRSSMLSILRSSTHLTHPYYWAAFTVSGRF